MTLPSIANAAVPEWVNDLSRRSGFSDISPSDQAQVTCLALIVYYEARGESYIGQRAVAEVAINRTRSPKYPSTICDVMFQHRQFSFVRGREKALSPRPNAAWDRAKGIAQMMFSLPDTENRWLSFCNCRRTGFRIGNHVFYGG